MFISLSIYDYKFKCISLSIYVSYLYMGDTIKRIVDLKKTEYKKNYTDVTTIDNYATQLRRIYDLSNNITDSNNIVYSRKYSQKNIEL